MQNISCLTLYNEFPLKMVHILRDKQSIFFRHEPKRLFNQFEIHKKEIIRGNLDWRLEMVFVLNKRARFIQIFKTDYNLSPLILLYNITKIRQNNIIVTRKVQNYSA